MQPGAQHEAQPRTTQRTERVQRQQETVQQQPQAPEQPRTPGEQIKMELDNAKAWSGYYTQQESAVTEAIAAVDAKFMNLHLGSQSEASVRAEYQAILAQRDEILRQKAVCTEAMQRLQTEYDPFQKIGDAVKQFKESSTEIQALQADQQRFQEERAHFEEQLQTFEADKGPQEQAWNAKLQETQVWTENYRTELEKLQAEHDLQRFHLPIALDANGKAKPGYEQFIQGVQATKAKIDEHQSAIQHNAQWLNWYDGQLKAVGQERSRLTQARDEAAKGLENTLSKLLAEEQKLRAAEAQHAEALPQAQANAYARAN